MSNKGGGSLLSPPLGMGRHSCKSQNFSIGMGGGTAVQLQRNQNLVFKHHLPSRHIIFTQFWGSLGETRENSGALKLSPAAPILPLGHIKLTSTLPLVSQWLPSTLGSSSNCCGVGGGEEGVGGGQVPAHPSWSLSGALCLLLISTGHPMFLSFLK